MQYLKRKLNSKKARVLTRYRYYEMKNSANDLSDIIPDRLKWLSAVLGWCAKSVDTLADRLAFDAFANDEFYFNEIFRLNNADILFDSAVLSSLISSCSFIYIGKDGDGYPFLQVIDGSNATGSIDPVTDLLTEGYAVLEKDEFDKPILEAHFKPYQTDY